MIDFILAAAPDGRKDKKKESKRKTEEVKPQKAKRLPPADFKVLS